MLVLAAVAILALAALPQGARAGDGEPRSDAQASPEEQLAARHAPILYIPQQSRLCADDGTPYHPVPVEMVLDNPYVVLRGADREVVTEAPSAADLFQGGPELYLDFPGNPLSPGCRYELDHRTWSAGYPPVTYARVAQEEGRRGVILQYWFFYYFNDWNNNHEGDWELIQLVFDAESVQEALAQEPDRASYAQHGGGERADWDHGRFHQEGGRPVVYVATGSHASQFTPRMYLGHGEPGTGFGCDDARGPHRRVEPEVRLMPEPGDVDSPDDDFAWLTFEGRWGQRLPGHNNGPTGPNMKRYFHAPLSWEEEHRSRSIVVPGDGLFGTQGVSTFCDVAAFGGTMLLMFTDSPVLVTVSVSVVAIALATVAAGLALAVWRARSARLAGPDSYRQARSIGQIIRATAIIYRAHWRPMLLLAIVLVPAGAAIASLQRALWAIPYVGTIFDLAGDRGFNAFATLIYGYGATLPVFAVVTAGVVATMHQLERGQRPSARESYRVMLSNALPVIGARLRAVVIVTLLFVSIIGIPLAIYFMVRWLFIEETIILSGSSWSEAAARSSTLVHRHWWRTLFVASLLGGIGGFSVPFLVLTLILWTPLPVELINAVSALAYAALLPAIGVMLTFAYWDLSDRYARSTGLDHPPLATADR